jgi:Tn3 transposase DDE domain
MMSSAGPTTGLAEAFVRHGRIFKTLYLLHYVDDEAYRRVIGVRLTIGGARHNLACRIFFGRLGEPRAGYRDGMQDRLSVLGLALNAVVHWNSSCTNAAAERLEAQGRALSGKIRARRCPLIFEHVNVHGRSPIVRTHADGQLRELRPLNGDRAEQAAGSGRRTAGQGLRKRRPCSVVIRAQGRPRFARQRPKGG